MTDFSQIIAGWETFYLLAGTAAATLIGLLFVAISINVETFRQEAYADLQVFATLTFNCFFYVLFVALLFLVPGISLVGLGVPLLLLGLLGLGNALLQQRRARRLTAMRGAGSVMPRFRVPMLALLGLAVTGALLTGDVVRSLYGLIAIVIALLGSAGVNAYVLLVHVEGDELAQTPQSN